MTMTISIFKRGEAHPDMDEAGPSEKESAAADILKALEKKSATALAMALESFLMCCNEEEGEE